ncbi:hypothetical protein ABH908_000023 [Pseudomonas frederiksbergensis]|uniref:hypothetical protein n=1 Tax=Pseudomonas TaxID=286 RepID=UPI003D201C0A
MAAAPFTLTQANASLLAFVFDGLCRINQAVRHSRMEEGRLGFAEEVGTGEDRLLSAALMIASQAVQLLQPALDCYIAKNEPGVFEYDALEFFEDAGIANCCSLPAYIWRFLEEQPSYWLLAAESLRPNEVPLDTVIAEWREANELI